LDYPASETMKNKPLWHTAIPNYGILLQQPKQTKTSIKLEVKDLLFLLKKTDEKIYFFFSHYIFQMIYKNL
jgi:hypothetical protein